MDNTMRLQAEFAARLLPGMAGSPIETTINVIAAWQSPSVRSAQHSTLPTMHRVPMVSSTLMKTKI